MSVNRFLSVVAVAVLATALASINVACGGGGSPSSGSTPPVTPTPAPTPTPPIGGGGNPGASCALGPGSIQAECAKTSPKLLQAVLEAMARGRSVVATRVGGPAELVPEGAGVLATARAPWGAASC